MEQNDGGDFGKCRERCWQHVLENIGKPLVVGKRVGKMLENVLGHVLETMLENHFMMNKTVEQIDRNCVGIFGEKPL